MRNIALILAAFALTACNGDDDTDTDIDTGTDTDAGSDTDTDTDADTAQTTFTATLTGSGFNPHAGQMMTAAIVDIDGLIVASESAEVPTGGAISFTFTDALEAGEDYTLEWYADFRENGHCDEVGVDHQWSVAINDVTEDSATVYDHDTNFTDICDAFNNDATLTGTGYNPHIGDDIYAAVLDSLGNVVQTTVTEVPDGGAITYDFADAITPDGSYTMVWWVDMNDDGTCTFPAEHQWSQAFTADATDTTVTYNHDTQFTDVCNSFNTSR